jgi:hypothetical protein
MQEEDFIISIRTNSSGTVQNAGLNQFGKISLKQEE